MNNSYNINILYKDKNILPVGRESEAPPAFRVSFPEPKAEPSTRLRPAKGTRHQRDFSANLARKNREISAKNALKT